MPKDFVSRYSVELVEPYSPLAGRSSAICHLAVKCCAEFFTLCGYSASCGGDLSFTIPEVAGGLATSYNQTVLIWYYIQSRALFPGFYTQ